MKEVAKCECFVSGSGLPRLSERDIRLRHRGQSRDGGLHSNWALQGLLRLSPRACRRGAY